jgi:hypothetical protein
MRRVLRGETPPLGTVEARQAGRLVCLRLPMRDVGGRRQLASEVLGLLLLLCIVSPRSQSILFGEEALHGAPASWSERAGSVRSLRSEGESAGGVDGGDERMRTMCAAPSA